MQTRRLAFLLLLIAGLPTFGTPTPWVPPANGDLWLALFQCVVVILGLGLAFLAARRVRPDRLLFALVAVTGLSTICLLLPAPAFLWNWYRLAATNGSIYMWGNLCVGILIGASRFAVVPVAWMAAVRQTERGERRPYLWLTLALLLGPLVADLPLRALYSATLFLPWPWMRSDSGFVTTVHLLLIGTIGWVIFLILLSLVSILLAWVHLRGWRPVEAGEPEPRQPVDWRLSAALVTIWAFLQFGLVSSALSFAKAFLQHRPGLDDLILTPQITASEVVLILVALGLGLFLSRRAMRNGFGLGRLVAWGLCGVALYHVVMTLLQVAYPSLLTSLNVTALVGSTIGEAVRISAGLLVIPAVAGALADRLPEAKRARGVGALRGGLSAFPFLLGLLVLTGPEGARFWLWGILSLAGLLLVGISRSNLRVDS